MVNILLASHGELAGAMKRTFELFMGKTENVHSLCAYLDEDSMDLPKMVDEWINRMDEKDTWIILTDLFGGSVNNEFMNRIAAGNFYLVCGMNLPLLFELYNCGEDPGEKELTDILSRSKETILYCNPLIENETDNEDF